MRILHCTDTYPPQVNGVSVVTALAVDGLLRRGIDVAVVAPRYAAGAPEWFNDRRAPVARLDLPAFNLPQYPDVRVSWLALRAVERFARDFRPDLIHADTEFIVGRLGARAARRLGVPLVTSFHTNFGDYFAAYGYPWLSPWVERQIVAFHQRSRRIYTPSSVSADWLRARGLANIEVWGRAVDTNVFRPADRAPATPGTPAAPGADGRDGTLTFLHVGRLAAEKNLEVLIRGFALAQASLGARIRLVIAGDGPVMPALRAMAPPGVEFTGFIDRELALPALYASADAFLNTSTSETLGLVILEAMACALPVAAVVAGGVADHLRHEVNGLAIAPTEDGVAQAIARLAADPGLRARLGRGARAWAESLGWDRELDRLAASYAEAIAGAPPARG